MIVLKERRHFAASLFFFKILAALTVGGCASGRALKSSPEQVRRIDVPFYSNTTDQCGPAALSSVLAYWGKEVPPEEIKSEIYVKRLRGTLPMDMAPALEARGFAAQVVRGSFDEVKQELRADRPVIAYLDFGTKKHPIGHFLVITGFDDERQGLYIHSGPAKNKFATYRRFRRGWKDTDYWMLVARPSLEALGKTLSAAPPPRFETPLSPDEYYELGQIYEKKGEMKEAADQYRKALALEKHFEPALVALGNLAYQSKNYPEAKKMYRRVLKKDPRDGTANNNLAMVYLETGELDKAELYATRALSTNQREYADDTLTQIRLKKTGNGEKAGQRAGS